MSADSIDMANRLAGTVLAADADMVSIHQRIVRVGAAASWAAAAFFLMGGFLGGREAMFLQAIGPILIAGFMTTQIALRRENGGLAIVAAALVSVVLYGVLGNEDTLVAAALALIVICSIGMLLVESRPRLTVGVVAVALAATPALWGLPTAQAAQLGLVMGLGFAGTSTILLTIRNTATRLNDRYLTLFRSSPTAVMEEDWSEALAYVRSEYTGRAEQIKPFLMAYPAVVRKAVSKARIVRVNKAAISLLEADGPDDLIGYREGTRVDEDSIDAYVSALVSLYEGRETFEHEMKARTTKGRPLWLHARSVDTSTTVPATTIIVGLGDITHMKERQEAMAGLVKAKNEFIARVSHELRTPLTAVVGLTSEMTSLQGLSDEEREELMRLVSGQAAEMSYIVDDLLVAARAEMGTIAIDMTPVDLCAELMAAVDGLGLTLVEYPGPLPDVLADPSRVRQVLRNLLTNALRYGGDDRRVLAGSAGDRVWLEVRDDGDGVADDQVVRIFEPYATAHSGVKGSVGLGLSVARQLTEMMGGTLTYDRDLGETVFRLELLTASRGQDLALASRKAIG